MNNGKNRTVHHYCRLQRAEVNLTARYRIDHTGDWRTGHVRDLSEQGLSLSMSKLLNQGAVIEIEIVPDGGEETIYAVGEVIWQKALAKSVNLDSFTTGVHFIRVQSEHQQRLRNWLTPATAQSQSEAHDGSICDKKFIYEKHVYLKQTNLEGNTYYDNYLTWQGEVREAILFLTPNIKEILQKNSHIRMITHSLTQRFIAESTFGDTVLIEMTTRHIRTCSLTLVFRYYNKETRVFLGEGTQRICFIDTKTGKICKIPSHILALAKAIEEPDKRPSVSHTT